MAGSSSPDLVLALDEGTTNARAIVFDRAGTVVSVAQREFEQRYPTPGDVRHNPRRSGGAVATAREATRRQVARTGSRRSA
jgi:glycerol kinase